MPCSITSYRSSGPSPAIYRGPKKFFGHNWNPTKKWIQQTTALDTTDKLDAMLVRAHADSNCRSGLELQKHG